MSIYTVHEPDLASDAVTKADRTVVMADRFSLAGLVFGPFYLLWHRLWLPLVVYVVVAILVGVVGWALKLQPGVFEPLFIVAHAFIGLEGRDLRRWQLERRGYRMAAVISSPSRTDAETAFFRSTWAERSERSTAPVAARTPIAPRPTSAVIGMFDHGDP